MNYGHFDADAREYVITRPATPRAWSNYIGSRKYGGIITAGAGGYSFVRSPAEGRILRHRYNSVPMDLPGRQFYIRDAGSGDFWSAAWQATAKPLDAYQTETRFGPGYALFTSTYAGICSESLYFPEAVVSGTCTNSAGFSDNTCGAIQSRLTLAPGASADVLVLLGIGPADTAGRKISARYADTGRVDRELADLKAHWHGLLGTMTVHTPDPAFEHMVNTWGAYNALMTYAEITASLSHAVEQAWAESELSPLDANIAAVCWDGDWFIWAIAEDGTVFGTKNYPEGQVYLNTQAWAVLSGAASDEQSAKSLAAVRSRLASEWGVAMCAPPFEKTPVNVMRAVLFNPGNKENGGIFSHTQSWAVLAEVLAGDGDTAWRYYRSFMPSAQNDRADIREIEPYVHCQSTHSQFSEKFGRSRIPWLSGTASWAHFTATNFLLGIRPEPSGLRIDPVIPRDWPGFTATRKFRGANIHIEIKNPGGKNRGITQLTVNGTRVEGNLAPVGLLKPETTIEAVL